MCFCCSRDYSAASRLAAKLLFPIRSAQACQNLCALLTQVHHTTVRAAHAVLCHLQLLTLPSVQGLFLPYSSYGMQPYPGVCGVIQDGKIRYARHLLDCGSAGSTCSMLPMLLAHSKKCQPDALMSRWWVRQQCRMFDAGLKQLPTSCDISQTESALASYMQFHTLNLMPGGHSTSVHHISCVYCVTGAVVRAASLLAAAQTLGSTCCTTFRSHCAGCGWWTTA